MIFGNISTLTVELAVNERLQHPSGCKTFPSIYNGGKEYRVFSRLDLLYPIIIIHGGNKDLHKSLSTTK